MKKDIHPDYVETTVTCTCGNTFTTRSTAKTGVDPRRRLLAVPPVLHGQAEDPRHRRPRRPVRGALRQEGRRQVAFPTAPVRPLAGGPARRVCARRRRPMPARPTETPCSTPRRPSSTSTPSSSAQLADPAVHADPDRGRELGKRYAELGPTVRRAPRLGQRPRRPRRRPRAGRARTPSFAAEVPALEATAGRRRGPAAPAAAPARPRRRPRRHPRGQGGGGRRGVGAVRRRPAADVPAVRRAARLGDRGARRHRVRPRRLQGRARRGEGARHRRAGRGAVGPAEVRGRRAPRAARAGHRDPGPHPHLARPACWCCPRPRTSRSRSTRTTCASTSSARRGPGGQSVNTTDSAVRITHLPTGIVVSCQNEKSQLQNRRPRCASCAPGCTRWRRSEAAAEASDARRSQVRTVDRSERIRTYNFPENRISDHRIGFKAYNLDAVLDGDLDAVVQSCVDADEAARLAAIGRSARDRRCAAAVARGDRPARRRPASPRPRSMPRSSPPTRSARTPADVRRPMVAAARVERAGRLRRPRRASARPACRCSTSPAGRTSAG